jgi:hypothetical protein
MTETKRFQRKKEDFICEKCGASVVGNGFTNHCPHCLWSKHVDINPGDRMSPCKGLMEPIGVEVHTSAYHILHQCTLCKHRRKNKTTQEDDFETILKLSSNPVE